MSEAIVRGSIADMARREGVSLALAWMHVDLIVICDRSDSMADDAEPGVSRYARADAELRAIQARYPGRVALIAFNTSAQLEASGMLPPPYGGTSLAPALRLARQVHAPGMRVLVITDGEVQDLDGAIAEARRLPVALEGLYVGPEGGRGAAMLRRICEASNGRAETGRLDRLLPTAQRLLTDGRYC